jgi:hypothetical protein
MNKENLYITVNGELKDPIEIVLREGQAAPIEQPVKYVVEGVIDAPLEYSKTINDITKAIVEYSFWDKFIIIKEDPKNKFAGSVKGTIVLHPDFVAFGINKDKMRSSKELINFVRKYAHCFSSMEEAKELITSLRNFEVSFEKIHVKSDDRKGNTEESVKNAVKYSKGEVKSLLTLSMPLFEGGPKVPFTVEVETEVEGSSPVFGFYSLDMEVILRDQTEEMITNVVDQLKKDFICLQLR